MVLSWFALPRDHPLPQGGEGFQVLGCSRSWDILFSHKERALICFLPTAFCLLPTVLYAQTGRAASSGGGNGLASAKARSSRISFSIRASMADFSSAVISFFATR